MSPGFRLISVVPGSWEFWGPVPVLVPVPVDSPAELLEVLVEKPDRFRRCFWGIPESRFKVGPADSGSDLDRIKAGPADSGSDLDRIKAGPADSGSVGLLENRPSVAIRGWIQVVLDSSVAVNFPLLADGGSQK